MVNVTLVLILLTTCLQILVIWNQYYSKMVKCKLLLTLFLAISIRFGTCEVANGNITNNEIQLEEEKFEDLNEPTTTEVQNDGAISHFFKTTKEGLCKNEQIKTSLLGKFIFISQVLLVLYIVGPLFWFNGLLFIVQILSGRTAVPENPFCL